LDCPIEHALPAATVDRIELQFAAAQSAIKVKTKIEEPGCLT
jgi:hypothetical protein